MARGRSDRAAGSGSWPQCLAVDRTCARYPACGIGLFPDEELRLLPGALTPTRQAHRCRSGRVSAFAEVSELRFSDGVKVVWVAVQTT